MIELLNTESKGESTIIAFYKEMAEALDPVGRTMLNHLARSLMERGWLPSVANFLEQLAEDYPAQLLPDVLADMQRRRLLGLDAEGKRIESFLGTLSLRRTPHRGEVGTGNFLFVHGGLELLALGPIFGKTVDCSTTCAQTGVPITLRVEDEQIVSAEPVGVAGFAANWDGKAPLSTVAANSPLFANDAALAAWQAAHPDVEGLPLSGDLLLFVGMGMMRESGDARHKCIAFT